MFREQRELPCETPFSMQICILRQKTMQETAAKGQLKFLELFVIILKNKMCYYVWGIFLGLQVEFILLTKNQLLMFYQNRAGNYRLAYGRSEGCLIANNQPENKIGEFWLFRFAHSGMGFQGRRHCYVSTCVFAAQFGKVHCIHNTSFDNTSLIKKPHL